MSDRSTQRGPARSLACTLALSGLLLAAAPGLAGPAAAPVAQHNSSAFWFENWTALTNATLKVSAPSGKLTEIFAASGTPVFELDRGEAMDGVYTFELTAATAEQTAIVNPINDGRGPDAPTSVAVSFYMTGQFQVLRGAIITPDEVREDG